MDLESLKSVHEKLLATIEETMTIAREGRERRRATEKELETMENDLRNQLLNLSSEKTRDVIAAARGTSTEDASTPAARN